MSKEDIKVIAYYLPQFHPTDENDNWWGKGFTEWTNVGRAKPLFKGHYQPRIPADLGYYDLRLPIVREQQVELAKEAGIYGFCYWHYWFGNGKQLLNNIFDDVLTSGKPDFPFCLGWANDSWYAKEWNSNGVNNGDKLLIEQVYLGLEDYKMHFDYVLKAFNDPRYIRINNKPLFIIYNTKDLPADFMKCWNKWAIENGLKDGICFIGRFKDEQKGDDVIKKGYSFVTHETITNYYTKHSREWRAFFRLKSLFYKRPTFTYNYKDAYPYFLDRDEDKNEHTIPCIIPNWDHSPRSGRKTHIIHNSTPKYFKQHVEQVLQVVLKKKPENQFIFLKSWNEWAEGNYMEPDLKFGKGYISALKEALKDEF